MGKKCISSWNFHTSQVGNSFNWEMYINRSRQFWFSIILSWVVKFLKWVSLYIIIYLKSVASSVFGRGVFKSFIIKWKHHSILWNYKFLLNFSSYIPQLVIEKATSTVLVNYLLFHIISWTIIVVFYILILEVL